jgi:hypothetical protein
LQVAHCKLQVDGSRRWSTGPRGVLVPCRIEGVPTCYRSGFITLQRQVDATRSYNDSTLTNSNGPCGLPICPDTSSSTLRDDDPQSGGSGGVVYDLDAPGLGSSSSAPLGRVLRIRTNFREWATDATNTNLHFSADFLWFSRISIMKTANGDVLQTDVTGDNTAGKGTTALSWNLQ